MAEDVKNIELAFSNRVEIKSVLIRLQIIKNVQVFAYKPEK